MPLGDLSYQDDALDAVVDSWPGSGANYHLYVSDPQGEDDPTTVELDATNGYTPVAFDSGDWDAADGGTKGTTAPVAWTPTGVWSGVANFWAVVDSSGLIVFSDFLDDPIDVNSDTDSAEFTPSLSFGVS